MMPDRRIVSEALRDWIKISVPCKIELTRRPSDAVDKDSDELRSAYAIVYPLPGAEYFGDLEDPERVVAWSYQITSVGRRHDQAAWLDDKIRALVLERQGSGFAHTLVIPGCDVIDRSATGDDGAAVPSDGSLVPVQSTYILKVSRS
jgi:hypothetical protein